MSFTSFNKTLAEGAAFVVRAGAVALACGFDVFDEGLAGQRPGAQHAADPGSLAAVQRDGYGIVDVSTREADLEDVFLNLTRAANG